MGRTRDGMIVGYAALAIVIHLLEAGLPSPVPGIKPGLANVITLLVLWRHGWRAAAWVAGLRVLVSALLLGTFLSPTFVLSAGGALASLAGLGLLHAINRWRPLFSPYGLGMLSACCHIGAQFLLAWWLFVPHPGLATLLPILAGSALLFGLVSGWMTLRIHQLMPPALCCPEDAKSVQ